MHEDLPAWIKYRWVRPDADRYMRPDADRYLKPAPFDHDLEASPRESVFGTRIGPSAMKLGWKP
jgi:hypothetical protein